jgi:D-3-phosphoglycerate dehydrogenase / 2-oxoglutarate reductase
MKKKVIVSERIDESGIALLKQSDKVELIYFEDPAPDDVYNSVFKEACAVMVRSKKISREMIKDAANLEIIAKHGVGVDKIDVDAATDAGIPVTITPEANSDSVADLAMTMMLALSRNLFKADADLKGGRFTRREHYTGSELGGKTVGIIGLGRIGGRVARRCALGFGMTILAYDPFISTDHAARFDAKRVADLESLLKESDYITIHTPLTDLTRDMIGEKQLRMMKPDAFIINTARGGIINEKDLYRVLSEKGIRGAGLDVFVKEPPLPDENVLLSLDNIIVSSHLGSVARESTIKMATQAAEEILRVMEGKKPKHPINLNV